MSTQAQAERSEWDDSAVIEGFSWNDLSNMNAMSSYMSLTESVRVPEEKRDRMRAFLTEEKGFTFDDDGTMHGPPICQGR